MQTVFSQRLLAGLRALHGEDQEVRDDDIFQDPDDRVDPDNSGPQLSVSSKETVAELYALPATQAEQTSGRCPEAAAAGPPSAPDLLDPVVLRTMPPQVAAFMLYEPPEPPRWRTSLPPDGADDGAWCG
jgi:hypothetical protein